LIRKIPLNPLASVCIPTYNASRFIKETIKSVLDSSYSNLELIVNDDCSEDNTEKLVDEFDDKRIKFFRNRTNLGPGRNWNRALEKSSGEFIGLLNHDDLYGPFWLNFAVHVLRKHPYVGWVATAFRVIDAEGSSLGVVSRFPESREYSIRETFLFAGRLEGLGPAFLARREILEELEFYDEDAGAAADTDLVLRLAPKYPMYYSSYPHAAWRSHTENLTKTRRPYDQIAVRMMMLNKLFKGNSLPKALQQFKLQLYIMFYRNTLAAMDAMLKNQEMETFYDLVELLSARENEFQL
jgi:glycosyltransferase involved in cell wall biosynthesis